MKEEADITDDKGQIAYKRDVLCAFEMEIIIVFRSEIGDGTKDRLKRYIKKLSKAIGQPAMPLYPSFADTHRMLATQASASYDTHYCLRR